MHRQETQLGALSRIREMGTGDVIRALRAKNPLKSAMGCKSCGMNMHERLKSNGLAWYCLNMQCTKYKTTRSIRDGSFFARYRHSLKQGCSKYGPGAHREPRAVLW